jgi:hypothetical protein
MRDKLTSDAIEANTLIGCLLRRNETVVTKGTKIGTQLKLATPTRSHDLSLFMVRSVHAGFVVYKCAGACFLSFSLRIKYLPSPCCD